MQSERSDLGRHPGKREHSAKVRRALEPHEQDQAARILEVLTDALASAPEGTVYELLFGQYVALLENAAWTLLLLPADLRLAARAAGRCAALKAAREHGEMLAKLGRRAA